MKRRSLTIIVLLILALIVAVILVDFLGNRPDRRGSNPYALEVEQYKDVDPELISHEEARNLGLGQLHAAALVAHSGKLYLAGDSTLAVISTGGELLERFGIFPGPATLLVEEGRAYVGYKTFVAVYSLDGALQGKWEDLGERAVITGLAAKEDRIYVADAGNRKVMIFQTGGSLLGEFEGKAESEAGHGFIVPSANFDLAVNPYGELWVVNPGKHALENYSDDGRMRGYWEHASFGIEGFLGCCNPARITFMEDGSMVTSEKGLVRIKIYSPSGSLRSVVAGPRLFKEEGKAPDVAVWGDTIYALDPDRNVVRIFEPKDNG